VELLEPKFPPLLDTLEVVKHFKPIELNTNYVQKEKIDQIMESKMNDSG